VLRDLGVEYHGVDFTGHYIEIGRRHMPPFGLPPERLRVGTIENVEGRFDVVVCFNALLYCPDFHLPLERLCDAADRWLVLRTLLAGREKRRYVRDGHLDEGWNHLRAYFNIYAIDEVRAWIESLGFETAMPVDRRTGDRPECVNEMPHPWRLLLARRVRDERVSPPAQAAAASEADPR